MSEPRFKVRAVQSVIEYDKVINQLGEDGYYLMFAFQFEHVIVITATLANPKK